MDIDITLFFTMIYNVYINIYIIKHIEICDALNILENTKKQICKHKKVIYAYHLYGFVWKYGTPKSAG